MFSEKLYRNTMSPEFAKSFNQAAANRLTE